MARVLIIATFFLFAADTTSLFFLFNKNSILLFLLIHIITVLAFSLIMLRLPQRKNNIYSLYIYLLITALFFPVIGPLFAFLTSITIYPARKYFKAEIYKKYKENLAKASQDNEYVLEENRSEFEFMRNLREELSFDSFIDIIKGGNTLKKELLINKLASTVTSKNVSLLKLALKDPSQEVRLYASEALIKIESSLYKNIEQQKKKAQEQGTSKDYANLGNAYLKYTQIGIIDEVLLNYYLNLAQDAFRKSLDINTNQPSIFLKYAEILIKTKQYEKAKQALQKAVNLWGEKTEIKVLLGQLLFELKKYKEVQNILQQIDYKLLSGREKETVKFWKET